MFDHLLSLLPSDPVIEGTVDNRPVQQRFYPGPFSSILIAAAAFVTLLLIFCPMFICYQRMRTVNSKRAKRKLSKNLTMQSDYCEMPQSRELFQITNCPSTQLQTQDILNPQESDMQQFLKRSVSRILFCVL